MTKRKRRAESEMFSVMGRYLESGLTQGEFCAESGLSQSVFQYWWRRYRESGGDVVGEAAQAASGGGFVELRSVASAFGDPVAQLELLFGGVVSLRFSGGLPPVAYVAGLLRALERC